MPLINLFVNTTVDENDGGSNGQGLSLRDAILTANADTANEYVIVLQGGSTYTLSLDNSSGDEEGGLTGDLDITGGARISIVTANGSKAVISAAGITSGDRAFDVLANARLTLRNVEITGGSTQDSGGAVSIAKDANVVIEESTIKGNVAAIDGGAIYNKGNLSIVQSSIEGNKALDGAGIANYNSAVISQSSITGNNAISGGAIYNRDNLILSDSNISGNSATFGGAVYNTGDSLNITGSTITSNSALVAGGAVYNDGKAEIGKSNIAENISGERGGGIINLNNASLDVIATNVSGNQSKTGGGVDNFGAANLLNSTFNNNTANNGGGINNSGYGKAILVNATISGNNAATNGGGIANEAQLSIINGTIVNNTSDSNNDSNGIGGGIFNAAGVSATLKNTIVAQNASNDLFGSFRGNGNNLIGNTAGAGGTIGTGSDIINGNPLIGPLQNNGSGVLTHALLPGSGAIDKGSNSYLLKDTFDLDGDGDVSEPIPFDGKAGSRIVNGTVDIGAIEFTPEREQGTPGINVTSNGLLVTSENGATAQFTVVLNSQPTSDVTIALNSSDITEGMIFSASSIVFTSDNWNTPQAVLVTGVDDAIADGSVPYTIVTAAAVSADANYNGLDAKDVSAVNDDNERAEIIVNPISGLFTNENGATTQFTVILNSQPTSDVTIALSSSDTEEGTISTPSITFTPDNWNIAQTVTVTGVDDDIIDGSVPYTIVTAAAVSADANYSGFDAKDVRVANNDNETAGITVNQTSGLVTNENGATAQFAVVLNKQPTSDVTIALNSNDTTEGTISTSSITFTPANWNTAQTVTIAGVDDAITDGDVSYTIVTAAAVSADANYNGLDAEDVSAVNNDNDRAGVTVSQTGGLVTSENGATAQFAVMLNSQPTSDVTIELRSNDITEGTISTSSIIFNSANWNVAQTVTVKGVDDAIADGNVPYIIVTAATVSADNNYNGLNVADISLVNEDNEGKTVTVDPPTIPADKPGVIAFDKLPKLDFSKFNPFGAPGGSGNSEPAFELQRLGDLPKTGGLRSLLAAATAADSIKGSFVTDSVTDSLTFAKTGDPMGSGVYQMTLNTDGMTDENGNPIDGDGDGKAGGKFIQTFNVDNTGKRSFRLEDFVAGPGQTVKLPGSGGQGIDIKLDDATGVTKVEFDFVFDEDILGVNGVSRGANLPSSWNISSQIEAPGRLQVVLSGTEAIQGGAAQLINVVADVLPTAVYGSSELLQLDHILLNDGAIASIGDVGVHQVGKLGDLSGNGEYTSFDAALLSRVVQGIDKGFGASPLIDGNILGDINSNSSLTAEDVLSIAKKAVGLPQNEII
jgi:hypothetical protein